MLPNWQVQLVASMPRLASLALKSTDGLMKRKHTLKNGRAVGAMRKKGGAVGAMQKKAGAIGAVPATHYLSKTRLRPQLEAPHHSVGVNKKKLGGKIV